MTYCTESERLMSECGEINWCPVQGSKIVEFYTGKNVFVTGATGFLGKLLVEKLLRACPDINRIYILMRPKKGEDEHDRVDKLYNDKIFGPLSRIFPKFQHKISIIKGDISVPDLGLDPTDKALLVEQVNVIFHVAATIKFEEKITTATAINVRSTRDLLEIATQCKHLESFVHVSTAYANCNHQEIDEVFYETPMTADQLIEMVKSVPEKTLLEDTPKILRDWPNTYTFTKAIAEDAVREYSKYLPVCVFRPAIVIATSKEPLRSWIDNLNGATGIAVGAGTGFLKTFHCDKEKTIEIVPADYVINSMIAASYQRTIEQDKEKVSLYNYVSSVENRCSYEEMFNTCKKWADDNPTMKCIWYNTMTFNRFKYVHILYKLFLHYLPAVIMDFGMIVTGKTPIMMKIYKKIAKFESTISYFAKNEWKFYNNNTQALWNCLSKADQKMFPFSMKDLDWDKYHQTHVLGLRLYVIKDDPATLPAARKQYRRYYIANILIKTIFYLVSLLLFCFILSILF